MLWRHPPGFRSLKDHWNSAVIRAVPSTPSVLVYVKRQRFYAALQLPMEYVLSHKDRV